MNDPITISEVVGRAVQGMTKPFLCKVGFFDYYVKGAYAGLDSQCCEWVANRLVNLALPSAPVGLPMFEMGEVPHALIEESGFPDIRELGEGRVFASLRIDDGHEESLPVQLDMKRVISALELPFTDPDTFWKLP